MRTVFRLFFILIFIQVVLMAVFLLITHKKDVVTRVEDESVANEKEQQIIEQKALAFESFILETKSLEESKMETKEGVVHYLGVKKEDIPTIEQKVNNNDTQFVMISFDGSRSLSSWKKTLGFAQEMKSKNIPISFTYFISGVYLLPSHQKSLYDLSWESPGRSDINFGDSVETTDKRIGYMNQAIRDGHEIGSHLNGHFEGGSWTEIQWVEEFNFFKDIISNTLPTKIDRNVDLIFDMNDVKGIRSPLLSRNSALYKTLASQNFNYDTSRVVKIGTEPWKDSNGIWQFPLVYLTVGGKQSLSMDYNHYEAQTNVKDTLNAGTVEWDKAKKEVVDSYLDYFEREYTGVRAPINIGHHFSMWNDGVYWEALKEFASKVCSKSNVVCTNYSDLVSYLENSQL